MFGPVINAQPQCVPPKYRLTWKKLQTREVQEPSLIERLEEESKKVNYPW